MDGYVQVLNFAIPFFIFLTVVEWLIGLAKGVKVMRSFDAISSISSGLSNILKDVLGLIVIIISYEWMVSHIALVSLEASWLMYLLAFIGLDFAGYWGHRFEHSVNLLWNRHVIHHSSEEFNLACALRQQVSTLFAIFFFLMIPTAMLGVPTAVIAIVAPIHLFAQFWYHTRLIGNMGFLEHIIVTPSHHRVHHAINDIYIDKNFSQILIIWDKFFGTFQKELTSVIPVYGILKQPKTWNPFIINFQHLGLLITDAWHTTHWLDKLRVFFMPTGWRPEDRLRDAPVTYTTDPSTQVKYDTPASVPFQVWMWGQLIITLLLTLYLFNIMSGMSTAYIMSYGLFIVLSIFSYTSLMDRSKLAIVFGILTVVWASVLIYMMGSWYGLSDFMTLFVISYLVLGLGSVFYFLNTEPLVKENNTL